MRSNLPAARALCGAALTLAALSPVAARAETRAQARQHRAAVQGNKNNMRNLAIAGAAVAGYGLFNHNNALAALGAAGAGLAGSQYENARKEQSRQPRRQPSYNGRYGRRHS